VPHPYSLTVTLGLCGGDWVLVDLSRLSGGISLTGDLADVRCLAQAVITELASGPVGALAEVVLVGSAAAPSVTDGLAVRSARLHTAPTRDAALLCAEDLPPAPASASSASRRTSRLLPGGRGPATAGTDTRRLFVVTAAEFRDGKWAETPLRGTDALLILGHVPDAAWNFHVNTDGSLDTGRLGLRIDTHTAIAG
jgi:hypothetical protein